MGTLYLARDPGLDRLVAIKVLRDDFRDDSDVRARFEREARSVARLKHPNIVVVYDVGEHEGRPFMAMEYIPGETLTALIERHPPLPLTRRLELAEQLCAGLYHAHRSGVIHRDIKPANMMLDADGVLKILDFGIARLANSGMTQDGMMMGTLSYMSPEQVVGRGVDHRSDIFATGAVLYELVALRQAFPGGVDSGVLNRILHEAAPPLREVLPGVDPELERIVTRALERDHTNRYPDANLMRRDLAHVRRRLEQSAPDIGGARLRNETVVVKPKTTAGPSPRKPTPERFVEMRRKQVDEHLRVSREAFERGDHQVALDQAERAAMIDPDNTMAFSLIERARFGVELRSVREQLVEASTRLADGRLDDAEALVDQASAMAPDIDEAAEIRREIQRIAEQIVAGRERERRIDSSLKRAKSSLDQGGYETALRAVYEVLAIDPDRPEAIDLERLAKTRLQEQREQEQARRKAYDDIKRARALAEEGRFDDALQILGGLIPASDTIRVATLAAREDLQRRKREAELARSVSEAEAALNAGQLESAIVMIDAIAVPDRTAEAWSIRSRAVEALRQQEELEHKRRVLDAAMASLQQMLDGGNLVGARTQLDEASRLGVDHDRVADGRARIEAAEAEAEARRRQEIRDRSARERVEAARQWFAKGEPQVAVALLERDGRSHPLIDATLAEMRAAVAEQEARARAEIERRRTEDEARRQAEIEAAKRRRETSEQEIRRRVDAARERFASGEADAAIAGLEGEKRGHPLVDAVLAEMRAAVAEQQRLARLEAERRQQEEDAKRRADAEAARLRAEGLERAAREREREERARREAEDRARREAEARAQAEADRRHQDEQARRRAEAEAARARAEALEREREERARRKAEEDARRKAEKDARRKAEEDARREAEEDARREAVARARRDAEARTRREAEEATRFATAAASPADSSVMLPVEASSVPAAYAPAAPVRPPFPIRHVWLVLVLVATIGTGAAVWYFAGDSTEPATITVPPPPPPPSDKPTAAELTSRAESLYATKQTTPAIDAAVAALELEAGHPRALDLLGRIRREAAAAAATAQQAATQARARGSLFSEAAARFKEAEGTTAASDTARAVALYTQAQQLYADATRGEEEQLKALLARAQDDARGGRRAEAAANAVRALAIDPTHRDALALVQTLRSDAAARALTARERSVSEGASDANSQAFRSGRQREREAEALGAPRQTADAIEMYALAEREYGEAVKQRIDQRARAATLVREAAEYFSAGNYQMASQANNRALELEPENRDARGLKLRIERATTELKQGEERDRLVAGLIARADAASNIEEKRRLLSEASAVDPGNATVRTKLRELPPPGGPQAGPSPTDASIAAIRRVLEEYEAAFAQRDRETLGRIWPSGLRSYEKQLPLLRSATVTFSEVAITVASANLATVRCRIDYRYEWTRAGLPPTNSSAADLTLRKEGAGAWVIVKP